MVLKRALRWLLEDFDWIQTDLDADPSLGGIGRSFFTLFIGWALLILPLIGLGTLASKYPEQFQAGTIYLTVGFITASVMLVSLPFILLGACNSVFSCSALVGEQLSGLKKKLLERLR